MSKRTAGAALIGTALALAVLAFAWWGKQTRDYDDAHLRYEFGVPMAARLGIPPPDEPELNRAGPLAVAGVAVVLFLSGIILVAVSPPPDEPGASDRPEPEKASP